MRTRHFLLLSSILFFTSAAYAGDDSQALQQGLESYNDGQYAGVKVIDSDGEMERNFPETPVFNFEYDKDGKLQTIEDKIPGYKALAVKEGSFIGKDVYKITTSSLDAFRSDVYSKTTISDIKAQSYNREISYVPDLQFIKSYKIIADNIVLEDEDKDTKLKQEVFGITKADFMLNMDAQENEAKYMLSWNIDNIRFSSSIISIMVASATNRSSSTYITTPSTDYNKLIADISALKDSQTVINIKDFALTFLGIKLQNSMNLTGKVFSEPDNKMRMSGEFEAYDFKHEIPDFTLQRLYMKYLLKNLDRTKLAHLQEISEKYVESSADKIDEADDTATDTISAEDAKFMQDIAPIIDDVYKDVELKFQFDAKFVAGDITSLFALKISGKILIGNGEITIYNIDKIFPDYTQQCEEEKKLNPDSYSQSCIKAARAGSRDKYIDKSKRTIDAQGRTVDKVAVVLNQEGVFINNQKVKDPIEIDIKKIITERLGSHSI